MPAKVKSTLTLKNLVKDSQSRFRREKLNDVVDVILSFITSGISPVKGQNRYRGYADSTAKRKGRKQPVTMIESGKMLESLVAKNTRGGIVFEFSKKSTDKIASYHQFGTKNLPIRKLLPAKRGETFKQKIIDAIVKAANEAVQFASRRQR